MSGTPIDYNHIRSEGKAGRINTKLMAIMAQGARGRIYLSPTSEHEATALQVGDKSETPLAELEARELGTAIEKAIGQLRPEYRSCIMLRHVEGLAYEEIAQLLDLPLGTVKTYIHRARHELRGMLAGLRD